MTIVYSLIISLLLTLIIELAISLILGIRDKQDIKVVILANCITNPVVVYIANVVYLLNNKTIYTITVAILEFLAAIVEYIIFKKYLKYKEKSPLIISIVNNIVSFSLGIIITKFI